MTSKEFELIKKMLQMQAKLDESIMKEYGLTEIDEENLRMAILDEVGELTHELKGNWCWWKKTQAPVDNDKVLGELVDIFHFVLSYQNHFNGGEKGIISALMFEGNSDNILNLLMTNKYNLSETLTDLSILNIHKIERLVAISEYLGFTVEQVYEAYCNKNKINYQRLKEGY
jgi:dimeric dUTPase (all-alpha-NTP-PPase superfamily)